MKLLYVVGNRPQFIKLAVLHHEARKHASVQEVAIHTGQHYSSEMSAVFFEELHITLPVVNLYVSALPHAGMIGQMMIELEAIIPKHMPDYVVVFGDTNTTLAGALTAKKLGIPVIHIEAGIRTGNEEMPEESNRYLTDRIAAVNFCCTALNMATLSSEGYGTAIQSEVVFSGDLMYDAYHLFADAYKNRRARFDPLFNLPKNFVLFTLHRKQNVEDPFVLQQIVLAINAINKTMPVFFAVHPNTANLITQRQLLVEAAMLPPQGYLDTQFLLQQSSFVITDSGGVQREAYFHQKPTLIVMDKPFWPEVMQHGCAVNSSTDCNGIVAAFAALSKKKPAFKRGVFGNGAAAAVIIQHLLKCYHEKTA